MPGATTWRRERARAQRWLHAHPRTWRLARSTREALLRRRAPVEIGAYGRFHPNDFMLRAYGLDADGAAAYLATGRQTVDAVIRLARDAGADVDAGRYCEIGAGYGRLLRVLFEMVPRKRVLAVELDASARRFCRDELGIDVAASTPGFDVDLDERCDVVFAISVITHVDWAGSLRFLRLAARLVGPGGALVFSSHGEQALAELEQHDPTSFGGRRPEVERAWQEDGFYYAPYRFTKGEYGMTWHRPDVVRTMLASVDPDLEVVAHEPAGLLGYQDLWCVRRPATR